MVLTSNDSQKYRKFIISTWYLCLERKIMFIPNPTNEIKCCFCFFYQISLPTDVSDSATNRSQFIGYTAYTSSRKSSRRERRDSSFRKSSIWIPSNLFFMNVDSVTFCVSKLRSWRSNARCCLFAYNSAIVNMTHSRVNIMTATSDNWSGTRSSFILNEWKKDGKFFKFRMYIIV